MKAAFTLLEILFACTIVAVLVAIAIPTTARVTQYSARLKQVSNLRQLGVAAHLYANDHNQQLPGHLTGNNLLGSTDTSTWPELFSAYLSPSDPRVFLDPTDKMTARLPLSSVLSGSVNNTGYIYNGFDDLAPGGAPPASIRLTQVEQPTQVILLAPKVQGASEFYADLLVQPLTDLLSQFNPVVYDGGAHYLFLDGSVRFLKQSEYSNNLWLCDKTIQLPTLPDLPLLEPHSEIAGGESSPGPRADCSRPISAPERRIGRQRAGHSSE